MHDHTMEGKKVLPACKKSLFKFDIKGQLPYVCFANGELDWQAREN